MKARYVTHIIQRTFVLEEVTHPRPARKDKLCDVLDDLGLLLLRHREEPFRESDLAWRHPVQSVASDYA